jgi:hypothetical protein
MKFRFVSRFTADAAPTRGGFQTVHPKIFQPGDIVDRTHSIGNEKGATVFFTVNDGREFIADLIQFENVVVPE